MQGFIGEHRPLILKHARAFVRAHGEKIAPEDIARELELVLQQLADQKGTAPGDVTSPDAYLRAVVLHAARRAKRRRTLIEQIAAGDDLQAVTDDLRALDSDLPNPPDAPSKEAGEARRSLDAVMAKLAPRDALVFALLFEDDATIDDAARCLSAPLDQIAASRERALRAADALGIEGDPDRRATGATSDDRRDAKLRALARIAGGPARAGGHVDEPLLALVRDGDQSDDLADALAHLAGCPDCRACLTEGTIEHRAVVVMAIEAPKAATSDLTRAAEQASARLFERGDGRWTAVVAAEKSESLVKQLETRESSIVSRIGVAEVVDVPGVPSRRGTSHSIVDAVEAGTDAAEVQAWAKAARAPKRRVARASAGWTAFAVGAVLAAIAIAYFLATR